MITVIPNDDRCFFGSGNYLIPLYRRMDTHDYHDYHEFSPSGRCSASWVTAYMLRCVFVTWPSLPIMESIFVTVARSFFRRLAISILDFPTLSSSELQPGRASEGG